MHYILYGLSVFSLCVGFAILIVARFVMPDKIAAFAFLNAAMNVFLCAAVLTGFAAVVQTLEGLVERRETKTPVRRDQPKP